MLFVVALALKHQAASVSPVDQALMPPADFASASPAQQQQEIEAAINGYLGSAAPGSLLQKKQNDNKWTMADNAETEDTMKKGYQDLDHVQDSLIKAANEELKEQKQLPTLKEATTTWDVFNNAVAASEKAHPSSFIEVGAKGPQDVVGGIDFGKIDAYERDFAHTEQAEKSDLEKLEEQKQRDEAFEHRIADAAQRSEAASHLEMAHEEKAKDHFLLAKQYEREGQKAKAHAHSMGHSMEKLAAVNARVSKLEHNLLLKAKALGMQPAQAKQVFHRLDAIREMSNEARKIMGAGAEPKEVRAKQLLALRDAIKAQTRTLVHELVAKQQHRHAASFVEGKARRFPGDGADKPQTREARDFDEVTSHANDLTSKIKKEISEMKQQEHKEDREKLMAMEEPKRSPNEFDFAEPTAYAQTNELRRN